MLDLAEPLRTRLGWFVKAVSRDDDALQLGDADTDDSDDDDEETFIIGDISDHVDDVEAPDTRPVTTARRCLLTAVLTAVVTAPLSHDDDSRHDGRQDGCQKYRPS